jgi:thiol-disulfide isomerase/thioredoxin
MNRAIILLLSGMILVSVIGCTGDPHQAEEADKKQTVASSYTAGSMPFFSLPSALDGKPVASSIYDDHVLLVVFFATWCKSCIEEIDDLIKLQDTFSGEKFSVIGLSVEENNPGNVRNLIRKKGINYPVLMANQETKKSFGGISTIPTFFLVGRDGMIKERFFNHNPPLSLRKNIESLLLSSGDQ